MERPFPEGEGERFSIFSESVIKTFLLDKGYPFDVTEAVLSISFDELVDVQGRIDALRKAREWKDFESIVIAFKRAMNILKGAPPETVDPSLLSEDVEKNLYQSFLKAKEKIEVPSGQKRL